MLAKHGYPLMQDPRETWYRKNDVFIGQREFLAQDPDGYLLRFVEHIGIREQKP